MRPGSEKLFANSRKNANFANWYYRLSPKGGELFKNMDNKVVLRAEYSAPECKIREIPMSYSFLQSIGDWKEDPEELN